jgi:hypothetical protein
VAGDLADAAGQRRTQGQADQRHPALEDHEHQGDAQPLPERRHLAGSDRGGDREGVQAERKHEGQQLQHGPRFHDR